MWRNVYSDEIFRNNHNLVIFVRFSVISSRPIHFLRHFRDFEVKKGHFTHLNTPIFPTFVFSVCIISNRSTKFGRQKWLWALSPVNRLRPTGLSRRFSEIRYLNRQTNRFPFKWPVLQPANIRHAISILGQGKLKVI